MIKAALLLIALGVSVFPASPLRPGEPESRCATPKFEQEYENSAAVFVGTVTETKQVGEKKAVTIEVERYWKGVSSTTIVIKVYENVRFQSPYEEGKTYLVFAKKDEDSGELYDQRCSRSAEIGSSVYSLEDDLKNLGKAKTCISLDRENK